MTTSTQTITLKSPVTELFTSKHEVQMLVKFLETKGFKTEAVNVPIYDRLVAILKIYETPGSHN